MRTVAALFVSDKGPYPSMPGVECWTEARDARLYDGAHPCVAHPPCARWCRLAKSVEARLGYKVGDDGGCFASALASVRRCGGVLEHPASTLAWSAHDLLDPPAGGWQRSFAGEWVCELAQSAYGHVCTKLTWLLLVGSDPPVTSWARPKGAKVVCSYTKRKDGTIERRNADKVTSAQAIHSPPAFAEFLVELARRAA